MIFSWNVAMPVQNIPCKTVFIRDSEYLQYEIIFICRSLLWLGLFPDYAIAVTKRKYLDSPVIVILLFSCGCITIFVRRYYRSELPPLKTLLALIFDWNHALLCISDLIQPEEALVLADRQLINAPTWSACQFWHCSALLSVPCPR